MKVQFLQISCSSQLSYAGMITFFPLNQQKTMMLNELKNGARFYAKQGVECNHKIADISGNN